MAGVVTGAVTPGTVRGDQLVRGSSPEGDGTAQRTRLPGARLAVARDQAMSV
jgi:hypothetical protein